MSIQVGHTAPDFSLYNSEKELVTLSRLRGKPVLLLFFPLAFTNTCTRELCSVRDSISFYNDVQAEVFGISVDSVHTLAKFKLEQHLNFQLLSDFNKEVSAAYDSLYENFGLGMKGVSKRSAFVIGPEGLIQYAEVLDNAGEVPDFSAINSALKAIYERVR